MQQPGPDAPCLLPLAKPPHPSTTPWHVLPGCHEMLPGCHEQRTSLAIQAARFRSSFSSFWARTSTRDSRSRLERCKQGGCRNGMGGGPLPSMLDGQRWDELGCTYAQTTGPRRPAAPWAAKQQDALTVRQTELKARTCTAPAYFLAVFSFQARSFANSFASHWGREKWTGTEQWAGRTGPQAQPSARHASALARKPPAGQPHPQQLLGSPTAISSSRQSQCVLPRLGSGHGATCSGAQGCCSEGLHGGKQSTRARLLAPGGARLPGGSCSGGPSC